MKIKNIKSILVPALGILFAGAVSPILASSCGEQTKKVPVEKIELNESNLELAVGDKKQLEVTVYPKNATNKKVTWKSSNPSVATVDQNGLVKAVNEGTATIIVVSDDNKEQNQSCEIKVVKYQIPVGGVELDKNELEIVVGKSEQLTATVIPENATNKKVSWVSSDPSVAKVNQNGLVSAVNEGTAAIVVITDEGNWEDTCEITVNPVTLVERILLNKNTLTLPLNTSEQLTATIYPENVTDKSVTWSSKDESIATVDETGLVKAISFGNTSVTVTAKDGSGKSATCEVAIVEEFIPVERVRVEPGEIKLVAGKTKQLSVTVEPDNATNKNVTWSSGDENIATVDPKTGLVTAVGAGNTIITAKADSADQLSSCLVIVEPNTIEVSLDKESASLMIGETVQLNATISPPSAPNKDVTWSSNKSSVATVNDNGLVTAISEGRATITVTAVDGGATATCKVIVHPIPLEDIELSESEIELSDGQSKQLSVRFIPENATNKNVTWRSYSEKVATVDQTGLVKAVGPGEATITVTSQEIKKTLTCHVTVKSTPVESVKLNKDKIELTEGKTEQLEATVLPETATNKKVTWSSSDEKVATVENGLVKAVKAGEATITVTTEEGGFKATCVVTITQEIHPQSVTLDKDILNINDGDYGQLTATVSPENATNKEVEWKSENESAVTVDQNGFITTNMPGDSVITVTTKDGGKTATCAVHVISSIRVKNVQLNNNVLELFEGDNEQLVPTILPENATNKEVTWESSDPSIATVDENGLVKVVGKEGKATITVTTKNSHKMARCEVTVSPIKNPVTAVTLDNSVLSISEGETEQLTATILPENASNKKVTWSSSDEKVATVDQTGLVSAVAEGTAIITVTTNDGGKTDTCEVYVEGTAVPVSGVQLDNNKLEIAIGYTEKLTATVSPETATDKEVTWSSSNDSVATVDQYGLVKAVAEGTAIITVTTEDGGKTATCEVKVVADLIPIEKIELRSTLMLFVKQKYILNPTISPANATNKKVTWSSSNDKVAIVDEDGFVTAVGVGKATITVTAQDCSGKTATCEVEVIQE